MRRLRSTLVSLSLEPGWCRSNPTPTGAVSCLAFACAMISANDPFGGGFEVVAAPADAGLGSGSFRGGITFGVADKLGLGVGLGMVGLEVVGRFGLDTTLGGTDDTAGLVGSVGLIAAELFATLFSGFGGRGSCSSALRLIPPLTFPLVEGGRRTAVGLRSSFLGIEAGAGEVGVGEVGT